MNELFSFNIVDNKLDYNLIIQFIFNYKPTTKKK